MAMLMIGFTAFAAGESPVQVESRTYSLAIPRGPLPVALRRLARDLGVQFGGLADADLNESVVGPIVGVMTREEALERVFSGTRLSFRFINDHTVAIIARPPVPSHPMDTGQATPGAYRPAGDAMGPVPGGDVAADEAGKTMVTEHRRLGFLGRLALLLGACTAATGGPACAQEAAPATESLQEIVVTAQKRAEPLNKIPISISAVSGNELQEAHITNYTDLTQAVPNVSFTTQGSPGTSTIEIRGISSTAGTAAIGVYLNDVSLTTRNLYTQGTAEPRFFDIDHVEVLRGPQGTLYGGGTLGGVLRFIEKRPNLHDFDTTESAEVSDTTHGGTNYDLQGVVNLPLVDGHVALRLGAEQGHDSGYIDQVSGANLGILAKGINSNGWTVAKAALLWQVNDAWSVLPEVFYQRYTIGDVDTEYLAIPSTQPLANVALPPLETSKTVREPATDRITIPSLTINGDLGFADLSLVGSFFTRHFDRTQDATLTDVTGINYLFPTGSTLYNEVSALNAPAYLTTEQRQKSIEVRLASKPYSADASLPITWILGAFYLDSTTTTFDNEPIVGINNVFRSLGLNINDPAVFPGSFPGAWPADDSSYYSNRSYNPSQISSFGDLDYYFRPDLHVSFGIRYESAKEHFYRIGNYYYTGCGLPAPDGTPQACPVVFNPPDVNYHATTPRAALVWDVTDTDTLYASASKGYREGSFNINVPLYGSATNGSLFDLKTLGLCNGTVSGCQNTIPTAFQPDTLWSYEIGNKSRWFDNRLSLDTSVYYLRWSNTQQEIFLVTSYYEYEANAGDVQSWGGEFDLKARPLKGLTLNVAGGFNQATFSNDVPALGNNNGVLNVSKGAKVPGVPDYNTSLGADYDFAYSAAVRGFVRADARFVGQSRGTFVIGAPDYFRPAYFTSDASTGIHAGPLEVSLFVKNLNNDQKILQRPNIQTIIEGYTQRPRTIGLRLDYHFADR